MEINFGIISILFIIICISIIAYYIISSSTSTTPINNLPTVLPNINPNLNFIGKWVNSNGTGITITQDPSNSNQILVNALPSFIPADSAYIVNGLTANAVINNPSNITANTMTLNSTLSTINFFGTNFTKTN